MFTTITIKAIQPTAKAANIQTIRKGRPLANAISINTNITTSIIAK